MSDTSSSVWRTAYVSAILEKDPVRLARRIVDARAAIADRLNCPVEIGAPEHEAIKAAREGLSTLKSGHVDVVASVPTGGDTPA